MSLFGFSSSNTDKSEKYSTPAGLKPGLEKLKISPLAIKGQVKGGALPTPAPPRGDPLDPNDRILLQKALREPKVISRSVESEWVFLEMISLLKPESPWRQATCKNYTTSFTLTAVLFSPSKEVELTSIAIPAVLKAVVNESAEGLVALLHRYPSFLTETALISLTLKKDDPVMAAVRAVFEADVNGYLVRQAATILETGLANGDVARITLARKFLMVYIRKEITANECFRVGIFAIVIAEITKNGKMSLETLNLLIGLLAVAAGSCNELLAEPLCKELIDRMEAFCGVLARSLGLIYESASRLKATDKFYELLGVMLRANNIQGLPETVAKSDFLINSLEIVPKDLFDALKAVALAN